MLYILDKKQKVVGVANNSAPNALPYFNDEHYETLEGVSTYTFSVPANRSGAEVIEVNGHVIVRDLDGNNLLFTIKEVQENYEEGVPIKRVYCENTAIDELLGDVQRPIKLTNVSLEDAANSILTSSSGWSLGECDYVGSYTVTIEDYTTVLEALRELTEIFNVEMYFTVKLSGNEIVKKEVNFVKERGKDTGLRFDYSKNLRGVSRTENTEGIVTALVAVGKGLDNGQRVTLHSIDTFDDGDFHHTKNTDWIGSHVALDMWSKDGNHIFGVYVDEKADTPQSLKERAMRELSKRREPALTYSASIVDLERVLGYDGRKLRIGDRIVIKDTSFNPPIVVSARVKEIVRSYTDFTKDRIDLGNYRKLKIQTFAEIEKLKNYIALKSSEWEKAGVTEEYVTQVVTPIANTADEAKQTAIAADNKATNAQGQVQVVQSELQTEVVPRLDNLDTAVSQLSDDLTDAQDTAYTAFTQAQEAYSAAQAAQSTASTALTTAQSREVVIPKQATAPTSPNVNDLWLDTSVTPNVLKRWNGSAWVKITPTTATEVGAVDTTTFNTQVTTLNNAIAQKADLTYVNGQLVTKENAITKQSTAPSNPTTNMLWLDTSVTPNVLKRWSGSAWVKVTPTTASEVNAYTKTEVDNALNSKVSVTTYTADMNNVVTRLNSAESRITQTENEISTKVSNTQYQQDIAEINSDITELTTRVNNAETSITQTANELSLKANKTDVYTKTEVDNKVATKADAAAVGTLEQRVTNTESQLTIQANQIASKVSQSEFNTYRTSNDTAVNTLTTRITNAEASITQQASLIEAKVSKSEFIPRVNGIIKVRYIRDWLNGNTINGGNHWVEIKAMAGTTNRAQGRSVTSNASLSNGSRITDGDINTNNHASGASNTLQYVQIDLGAVYSDIDYIQVWHYYADGRTYYKTKLEVSEDGTTWTPLFDSDITGAYKETSDGLIVPVNNKAIALLNDRVTQAETRITLTEQGLSTKVSQTTYDTDINASGTGLKARMSTAESSITQLSDSINLKVDKNGVISAINLSPEGVKISGNKVDITGQVTFNSLSSSLQQAFNADGTVKADKISGALTDSQIASAGTWNTIKDRVNTWTTNGKTTINGGLIETGTILANSLVISDFTNLCENPDFEGDAVGSTPLGFIQTSNARVADISGFGANGNGSSKALEIDARSGGNSDIYASNIIPVTVGQKFFIEAEARYLNTAGTGYVRVGFRAYDKNKVPLSSWTEVVAWASKSTSFVRKSGVYTVTTNVGYIQLWISFYNNGETTNKAYVDNIRVHRMAGGELIVDGSITASKIAAGTITAESGIIASIDASKITVGTVPSSRIDGSSINISNNAAIQDINGKLSNAVTTIDGTGVTIKDGNFRLEKTVGGTWIKVDDAGTITSTQTFKEHLQSLPNLLVDHSFEMMEVTGSVLADGHFDAKSNSDSFGRWATYGTPKILSTYYTDVGVPIVPFGNQMVTCSNTNYVYQSVDVVANQYYTLSFHLKSPQNLTRGTAQIQLKFIGDGSTYMTKTYTFTTPTDDYYNTSVRHALTFRVPNAMSNYLDAYVEISLRSTSNTQWVSYDGVQLVLSSVPVTYLPDVEAWRIRRGGIDKYKLIDAPTNTLNIGTLEVGKIRMSTNQTDMRDVMWTFGSSNGLSVAIGGGAQTVIGAGEAAETYVNAYGNTNEHLHLVSDANVYIRTNLNSAASNQLVWTFDNTGITTFPKHKYANGYNMGSIRSSTVHDDLMLIQTRKSTISISAASQAYVDITFPVAFAEAPEFVIVQGYDSSSVAYNMTAYSITATGCRVYARHIDGTSTTLTLNFQVVACGRKP